MGCKCSSIPDPESQPPEPNVPLTTISSPQGPIQLVPRPKRDYYGMPVSHEEFQINRADLIAALTQVAAYLRRKNASIQLVAVGGAVNTILLRTRETTHDLDFLGASGFGGVDQPGRILAEASQYAQTQSSAPLGGNWFNNSTVLLIRQDVQREITSLAIKQNIVIFEESGLKVLAAPWSYAFCGKTNRLCEHIRRDYDCQDAVAYLYEYIRCHGGQPVSTSAIFEWASHFGKKVTVEVLREIEELYFSTHGRHGIVK
jgi:hypothetical protein